MAKILDAISTSLANMKPLPYQAEALLRMSAPGNRLISICGGLGSGKTTLFMMALQAAMQRGAFRIGVASAGGTLVSRLTEILGKPIDGSWSDEEARIHCFNLMPAGRLVDRDFHHRWAGMEFDFLAADTSLLAHETNHGGALVDALAMRCRKGPAIMGCLRHHDSTMNWERMRTIVGCLHLPQEGLL